MTIHYEAGNNDIDSLMGETGVVPMTGTKGIYGRQQIEELRSTRRGGEVTQRSGAREGAAGLRVSGEPPKGGIMAVSPKQHQEPRRSADAETEELKGGLLGFLFPPRPVSLQGLSLCEAKQNSKAEWETEVHTHIFNPQEQSAVSEKQHNVQTYVLID